MLHPYNPSDVDRTISSFVTAWNSDDDGARQRHLNASWSDAGQFEDPFVSLIGRGALGGYMAHCRAAEPGLRVELTGTVENHHRLFLCWWKLLGERNPELRSGCSFGELDHSGRIQRLTAFFHPRGIEIDAVGDRCGAGVSGVGASWLVLDEFLARCRQTHR